MKTVLVILWFLTSDGTSVAISKHTNFEECLANRKTVIGQIYDGFGRVFREAQFVCVPTGSLF